MCPSFPYPSVVGLNTRRHLGRQHRVPGQDVAERLSDFAILFGRARSRRGGGVASPRHAQTAAKCSKNDQIWSRGFWTELSVWARGRFAVTKRRETRSALKPGGVSHPTSPVPRPESIGSLLHAPSISLTVGLRCSHALVTGLQGTRLLCSAALPSAVSSKAVMTPHTPPLTRVTHTKHGCRSMGQYDHARAVAVSCASLTCQQHPALIQDPPHAPPHPPMRSAPSLAAPLQSPPNAHSRACCCCTSAGGMT